MPDRSMEIVVTCIIERWCRIHVKQQTTFIGHFLRVLNSQKELNVIPVLYYFARVVHRNVKDQHESTE